MSDRIGPGQAFAGATVEVTKRLTTQGFSVSLRWVPAHKGVEDNEMAGVFAKAAAEGASDSVGRQLPRQVSISHLTRVTTEARTQGTRD